MGEREKSPDEAEQTRTYRLGPFQIESELELPELRTGRAASERRVRIALGNVPASIAEAVQVDRQCSMSGREWLLRIPEVARYYVRDGCEVRVAPEPGAFAEDVRIYLLGSVFGVLCHQNGLIPLHASAVEQDGKVTAFLGDSGAGKSTLAACLGRRGHTVVSDDICLLERLADEEYKVHPVAGWLKLWRASLEQVGEPIQEENRVFSKQDKYRVFLGAETDRELRLSSLVFLERPKEGEDASISLRMPGNASALGRLLGLIYLSYFQETAHGLPSMFRLGSEVLASAPAWILCAPLGWDRMDKVLDLVEDKLLPARPTQ